MTTRAGGAVVECPFCGDDVLTREAREVYVPHAVTPLGVVVRKLAWAHPSCADEVGVAQDAV